MNENINTAMADLNKYFVQSRTTFAACRSRRLRQCGVSPVDARGLLKASGAFHPSGDTDGGISWGYVPGNRPESSVLVERGAFSACDTSVPFHCRTYNPDTHRYELHTAWDAGIRWHCKHEGTKAVPGILSPGWAVADYFEDLHIEIEEIRSVAGITLLPHVTGTHSGEEILPVSSIPTINRWERVTQCDDQCVEDDVTFNAAHQNALGVLQAGDSELGIERGTDGSIMHAPQAVTFTFVMVMMIGGVYKSRLYDFGGHPLFDTDGDALYTMEALYATLLRDKNCDQLTDRDNDRLFNFTEIAEATPFSIRGSHTIDLTKYL